MKQTLFSTALFAALTLPALAGTDMAPTTPDSKDMKDTKQMAQTTQSDAGFYVAALGGANFDTDYGDKRQTVTGPDGLGTLTSHAGISSNYGGVAGLKAGYNFQSFPIANFMSLRLQPAVEAEGLWINTNDNTSRTTLGGPFNANQHFSTNSGDFFLNGILRFKNSSIVTPYIGVGAGLQYITTHGDADINVGSTPIDHITGLNGSDLDFAGQALAGFDVALCQHVSLFTEYKFIDALGTDARTTSFGGSPGGFTYRFKPDQIMQNLITVGVKYSF